MQLSSWRRRSLYVVHGVRGAVIAVVLLHSFLHLHLLVHKQLDAMALSVGVLILNAVEQLARALALRCP